MKTKNNVLISVSEEDLIKGVFRNDDVIEIADNCFNEMPSLKKVILLKVKKIGNDCFSSNQALTEVSVPALTTCGNYCFSSNQALTEVSVPALTTCGNYCFSYNQALTEVSVPALTTCGNYCFRYNQALTEVKINKHKLIVKCVDDSLFIIESKHTSQGIRIYSGYNFLSMDDKIIQKQNCFVAEKDGYFAHGENG